MIVESSQIIFPETIAQGKKASLAKSASGLNEYEGEGANANLITPLTFNDLLSLDGEWFYRFTYRGLDDLDNESTRINCPNLFQVYQGDLPPLAAPGGLRAEAEPGGHIRLTWNEGAEAAGYVLYRKAPGEADLTLYENLPPMTEYLDGSLSAGTYYYALSSLRDQNGQVSESGLCEPVHATADSENPGPPSSLSVDMVPQGMKVEWQAPDPYTEPVTHPGKTPALPGVMTDGLVKTRSTACWLRLSHGDRERRISRSQAFCDSIRIHKQRSAFLSKQAKAVLKGFSGLSC